MWNKCKKLCEGIYEEKMCEGKVCKGEGFEGKQYEHKPFIQVKILLKTC